MQLFVYSVLERKVGQKQANERAANLLAIDLKELLFSHIALEDKKVFPDYKGETQRRNSNLQKCSSKKKEVKIRKGQLELYKNIVLGV